MSKLVTIFGGSGFVGRYIAQKLALQGWRVRVAVRRPNEALFVKTYGVVGQVQPVFCNIRDDDSVRSALLGADAVVNCVGILAETGANTFDALQHEGAARIARLSAEQGIARLVHLSAIGADENARSAYARSKAQGEATIMEHFPKAVILRPSVIFGTEDQFFNRFAAMARLLPVLAIAKAETRFQPVYVEDVAQAAAVAVEGAAAPGIYELGGPDVRSFRELMQDMLAAIHRRRLIVNMPGIMAWPMAWGFDLAQQLSFGLFTNTVLTRDQLRNLANDNVVGQDAKTLADLQIAPTPLQSVLPEYLWPFRPSGQFDAIKTSAANLRSK